jgi:hypothetical protein
MVRSHRKYSRSLAAYEAYRARLADDPGAQANVAFVRQARAIPAERRSFPT